MILCIPVSVYLRTSKQFHQCQEFLNPCLWDHRLYTGSHCLQQLSEISVHHRTTGKCEGSVMVDDLDGDFFFHTFDSFGSMDFSFSLGEIGLEASNKYQPTVLEPRLRPIWCPILPRLALFLRSWKWDLRQQRRGWVDHVFGCVGGGLGCLAVQPDKGRWVVFPDVLMNEARGDLYEVFGNVCLL